jgi:hypothetical protein
MNKFEIFQTLHIECVWLGHTKRSTHSPNHLQSFDDSFRPTQKIFDRIRPFSSWAGNNVNLMINRCILKDTKVFESFFNAFGCIYSVLHRIGSIFQYNAMYL